MNTVLNFLVGTKDLVLSKEFAKGILIGGGIMAVAIGLHVLVRL